MTRTLILQQVAEYFASKGKYMGYEEYKSQTDTPVSAAMLKRVTGGSWSRVQVRIEKYFPELSAQIKGGILEEEAVIEPVVVATKGKK